MEILVYGLTFISHVTSQWNSRVIFAIWVATLLNCVLPYYYSQTHFAKFIRPNSYCPIGDICSGSFWRLHGNGKISRYTGFKCFREIIPRLLVELVAIDVDEISIVFIPFLFTDVFYTPCCLKVLAGVEAGPVCGGDADEQAGMVFVAGDGGGS